MKHIKHKKCSFINYHVGLRLGDRRQARKTQISKARIVVLDEETIESDSLRRPSIRSLGRASTVRESRPRDGNAGRKRARAAREAASPGAVGLTPPGGTI